MADTRIPAGNLKMTCDTVAESEQNQPSEDESLSAENDQPSSSPASSAVNKMVSDNSESPQNEVQKPFTFDRVTILKRQQTTPKESETRPAPNRQIRTLKEREAAYAEARLRILGEAADFSEETNEATTEVNRAASNNGACAVKSETNGCADDPCATVTPSYSGITKPMTPNFSGITSHAIAMNSPVAMHHMTPGFVGTMPMQPVTPNFPCVMQPFTPNFANFMPPFTAGFASAMQPVPTNFSGVLPAMPGSWPCIVRHTGHAFKKTRPQLPVSYSVPTNLGDQMKFGDPVPSTDVWMRNPGILLTTATPSSGHVLYRDTLEPNWKR